MLRSKIQIDRLKYAQNDLASHYVKWFKMSQHHNCRSIQNRCNAKYIFNFSLLKIDGRQEEGTSHRIYKIFQ
jgi:hypothetical protein